MFHSRLEAFHIPNQFRLMSGWYSLDFSFIPLIRVLTIGYDCWYSGSIELTNMEFLEIVDIGSSVATSYSSDHFYVKHCPALKTLIVGNNSFSCCSSCVLESLPLLESVIFGTINGHNKKGCFKRSTLEMRSMCCCMLMIRLASFEDNLSRKWKFSSL